MVPDPRRPPGRPLPAARRRRARPDRRAGPRGPGREGARRHRRPRRGQRVLRRGAHQRRRRAPVAGCRPTSPTCSWSASTASTTPRAWWSARPAPRAARSPTTCSPPPPDSAGDELDEGLRRAVEMNVLRRQRRRLLLPARAPRRGGVRRPAPRRAGAAARAVRRGAAVGCGAGHRRRAGPARPARRWTSTPRCPRASRPATRPGPSAVPTRRRTTTSRRSSCSPTDAAPSSADVDLSKLVTSAAEALERERRPAARRRAGAGAARPAARRHPAGLEGSRMLTARAGILIVVDTDEDPAEVSAEALALAPEGESKLRARALTTHARVLAGVGRYDEAQVGRHGGARALRAARPPPARLRGDHHPQRAEEGRPEGRACAPRWSTPSTGPSGPTRSTPSSAAGSCSGGPSRTGPSSTRPRSGSAAPIDRAAEAGLTWAPYAFESRVQLGLDPTWCAASGTRCSP